MITDEQRKTMLGKRVAISQLQTTPITERMLGAGAGRREQFVGTLIGDDSTMWLCRREDNGQSTWIDPTTDKLVVLLDQAETRTVTIPAKDQHEGIYVVVVTLPWVCPVCGGPRGEPGPVCSYDGSLRMTVDGWRNECGHIDKYSTVRKEAGMPA